jgi:hypothetical protein
VTLSPLTDPGLAEAAEALRDAQVRQSGDVRSAAEKWIGGITALFSLFGVAGITVTRSAVAGLGTWWQVSIGAAAAVCVALAGLAVYWIYRAAYGWPVTRPVTDDDELRNWYADQQAAPRLRAGFLRSGVRAAAGALAVLVIAGGLVWFAPQQQMAVPFTQATLANRSRVCGTLLTAPASGVVRIRRASDGSVASFRAASITALTTVTACLARKVVRGGQVAADEADRDGLIPGQPVRRREGWVTGLVHSDDLQPGVQAGGPR